MLYPDNYSDIDSGVGSCSPTSTEPGAYIPEHRSVQPFKSTEEYQYAMKEDLGEWLNCLYNQDVDVDNFFEKLETGVLLCEHANNVQGVAEEFGATDGDSIVTSWDENSAAGLTFKSRQLRNKVKIPDKPPVFRRGVKSKSFQSRDNIANFISWCRELGIPDVLLFETEDLVSRKNEKSVILCLLEVARKGSKFGMLVPCLIQLEQEIDAEIRGEEPPKPLVTMPEVFVQQKTCDMKSLDEMVRDLAAQCNCPVQFPIIRISEGKYMVGEQKTLIFVRILRNHVMVRVGGGWDTLENYLNKHDSCRAQGHKPSLSMTYKRRERNKHMISGLNVSEKPRQSSPAKSAKMVQNNISTEDAYSSESQSSTPRTRSSSMTTINNEDNSKLTSTSSRTNRPTELAGVKSAFRTIECNKNETKQKETTDSKGRFGWTAPNQMQSNNVDSTNSSQTVVNGKSPVMPRRAMSARPTRSGRQSPATVDTQDGKRSQNRPQSAKQSGRQSPAPFSTPQPIRRNLPVAPGSKTPTGTSQIKSVSSAHTSPALPRKNRSLSTTQVNLHGSFESISHSSKREPVARRGSTNCLADNRSERGRTPTSNVNKRRASEDRPRSKTPQPAKSGSNLALSKSAQIMKEWKTKDDTIVTMPGRQRRNSDSTKERPKSETRRSVGMSLENIPAASSVVPSLDEVEDLGGNEDVYSEMEKMFQEYKEQENARAEIEEEINKRILEKIKPAVEKYREEQKEKQRSRQLLKNPSGSSHVPPSRKYSAPALMSPRARTPTRERSLSLASEPKTASRIRPKSPAPDTRNTGQASGKVTFPQQLSIFDDSSVSLENVNENQGAEDNTLTKTVSNLPSRSTYRTRSASPAPSRVRPPSPSINQPQNSVPNKTRPESPVSHRAQQDSPSRATTRPQSPVPNRTRPQSPAPNRTRPQSPDPNRTRPQSPAPSRARPQSPAPSRTRPQSPAPSRTRPQSPDPNKPQSPSTRGRPQSPGPDRVRPQSPAPNRSRPRSPAPNRVRPQSPGHNRSTSSDANDFTSSEGRRSLPQTPQLQNTTSMSLSEVSSNASEVDIPQNTCIESNDYTSHDTVVNAPKTAWADDSQTETDRSVETLMKISDVINEIAVSTPRKDYSEKPQSRIPAPKITNKHRTHTVNDFRSLSLLSINEDHDLIPSTTFYDTDDVIHFTSNDSGNNSDVKPRRMSAPDGKPVSNNMKLTTPLVTGRSTIVNPSKKHSAPVGKALSAIHFV